MAALILYWAMIFLANFSGFAFVGKFQLNEEKENEKKTIKISQKTRKRERQESNSQRVGVSKKRLKSYKRTNNDES